MVKIEIKRWDDARIIISGEYESIKDCLEKNKNKSFYMADLRSADLRSANLRSADLSSADLRFADLRFADLRSADLSFADLRSADLNSADLRSANLRFADLRFAKNFNKFSFTPLYGMFDQPGAIIAYKIVNSKNEGIYNGGITYTVGATIEEKDADIDEYNDCGKGINLATLDWCIKEWMPDYKILLAEFTKADIACIPVISDGKFRVFRCKIIGEKNLKEIGIE